MTENAGCCSARTIVYGTLQSPFHLQAAGRPRKGITMIASNYERNLLNKWQRYMSRREAEERLYELREEVNGDPYEQLHEPKYGSGVRQEKSGRGQEKPLPKANLSQIPNTRSSGSIFQRSGVQIQEGSQRPHCRRCSQKSPSITVFRPGL